MRNQPREKFIEMASRVWEQVIATDDVILRWMTSDCVG